jgi:hypothetical protein
MAPPTNPIKKPIRNGTMKRVPPPGTPQPKPAVQRIADTTALVETLRERINDLETRLAQLEAVFSFDNTDLVINATGSVLIQAGSTVEITAGIARIGAGMVELNSGMTRASGVVQCDTIIANSVVGASYTPGAGNIW